MRKDANRRRCRERELQIILTTHSPYILDELPLEARAYILQSSTNRSIVYGVSPDFAMTKMDDQPHYECDLYVEDDRAAIFLQEILAAHAPQLVQRCQSISFGAASVGQALGIMVAQNRFPRPSCVFLDGDKGESFGCVILPGDDTPERVVFESLKKVDWSNSADRVARPYADFADACTQAMTLEDHHEWVRHAATKLVLGGDTLWHTLCAEWATKCFKAEEAKSITQPIEDALIGATAGAWAAKRPPQPADTTPIEPIPSSPFFPHRAAAAFCAISRRRAGARLFVRAGPPFRPP